MYQERKWRIEDDFFLNLNRLNWLTLTLKISNVPNIKLLINFNSLQETRIGWNCSTDINLKYVTVSKPLLIIRYKKLWQYPGMCCIWLHISILWRIAQCLPRCFFEHNKHYRWPNSSNFKLEEILLVYR